MTREEIISGLKFTIEMFLFDPSTGETYTEPRNDMDKTTIDACKGVIELLEQEPKTLQFAQWVASEIFDEMWEYNKDAFAEIACRKLAKLGIVRENGDAWELVEPQESEDKDETDR